MIDYLDEIIESWDKACSELDDGYKVVSVRKRIATAAPNDLFKLDADAVNLSKLLPRHFTTSRLKRSMSPREQDPTYR